MKNFATFLRIFLFMYFGSKQISFTIKFQWNFSLLTVLPENLKIRIEPKSLKAGTIATIHCDSSSSNPPVKLLWYKDGIPLMSDGGVINTPGLYGGQSSTTQVKLNITQDMNGVKIACQGTNEALQRSVNEAIELQVLCKQLFRHYFLSCHHLSSHLHSSTYMNHHHHHHDDDVGKDDDENYFN
jgi:hypothetical protein